MSHEVLQLLSMFSCYNSSNLNKLVQILQVVNFTEQFHHIRQADATQILVLHVLGIFCVIHSLLDSQQTAVLLAMCIRWSMPVLQLNNAT